jgi:hypothetical protein
MNKSMRLIGLLSIVVFPALTIISCSSDKTIDDKKVERKKVVFHLESRLDGKLVPGVVFSPTSFLIPKNITLEDFLRKIKQFERDG